MHEKDKYDIIIVAGQSNAYGMGRGDVDCEFKENDLIDGLYDKYDSTVDFDENGYLQVKKPWEFVIKRESERVASNGVKIGCFAQEFARLYAENYLKEGRKLLVVHTAVGGTGFAKNHWGIGNVLSERMYAMSDYALSLNKENKIVAMLWHQGEHDAFENPELKGYYKYLFYRMKFFFLMENVKEKYGDIPVIAGNFCTDWHKQYPKECNAIANATRTVLKSYENCRFVDSKELLSNDQAIKNGDNIHFCRQSAYDLGRRYFAAYQDTMRDRNDYYRKNRFYFK